ncbi:glycosyltransferase [Odoribacter sp. OttesenSCG-928-L07]|nr:glycosyltransferase [Odoribacter sp. OttesenSCG-928-L07]MDL2239184.1 glycosyltransferase [Bacteroidales bacterium OttesenSCG-928-L14]MDL2240528.1 glycosyltransferase [Bacteroidales bacterium OttesenSCG-928-K22]
MSDQKKKRVVISVINDLVTDQRVHKVATSLHNNGFDVLLIGRIMQYTYAPVKREYATKRFNLLFKRKAIFYITYNIRLFFFLLFVKADIFLSNDTDTLLANYYAAKIRRKKLVFDAHEMFPEMPELVGRKRVRKVWESIENHLFPKLKYSYTVCKPIADIYHEMFGINMQIIRNVPITKPYIKREKENGDKYVLLYQGAINVGRGLERMIDAMQYLDNMVFNIAGDGDIVAEMVKYVEDKNLGDKVKFLGRIPLEKLPEITASADLGISLLDNLGLNYYYSLPNRIFDFAHAGVPVLATDFPEIHNILTEYSIGELVTDESPEALAKSIKEAIEKWTTMEETKRENIFVRARKELCWEEEEKRLLKMF